MPVKAIKEYNFPAKDTVDKFHGAQLLYIGWEDHLLITAPFAFPLPPDMPFGAVIEAVIPGSFAIHPEFSKIDWSTVEWKKSGQPFSPDPSKSLAENGLKHKDVIRFVTLGLTGLGGSSS